MHNFTNDFSGIDDSKMKDQSQLNIPEPLEQYFPKDESEEFENEVVQYVRENITPESFQDFGVFLGDGMGVLGDYTTTSETYIYALIPGDGEGHYSPKWFGVITGVESADEIESMFITFAALYQDSMNPDSDGGHKFRGLLHDVEWAFLYRRIFEHLANAGDQGFVQIKVLPVDQEYCGWCVRRTIVSELEVTPEWNAEFSTIYKKVLTMLVK